MSHSIAKQADAKQADVEAGRPAATPAPAATTYPPAYPAHAYQLPTYTALAPPTGMTLGGVGWAFFALGFLLGPVMWALTWFIPNFARRLGAGNDEVKRARAAAITSGVFFAIYIILAILIISLCAAATATAVAIGEDASSFGK